MQPRFKVSYLVRAPELQSSMTNFWEVLCIILVLTSFVASGVSQQQPSGFISIDCGRARDTGTRNDPVTDLEWQTDEHFLDSWSQLDAQSVAVRATVGLNDAGASSRDNAEQLKTAMVFIPDLTSQSKYCYNLNVSRTNNDSTNYLLRVMFPSKDLEDSKSGKKLNNYGTRFYFTVDSTFVSTVELDQFEPQTVELVLSSLDELMKICLVPLEDRSSMPAISSIELRPLPQEMYERDGSKVSNTGGTSSFRTTYLMTVSRINFGGNELLPSVRYPDDRYDRLWPAIKIPEDKLSEITSIRSSSTRNITTGKARVPVEVLKSAWQGVNMNSEISFMLNISAARSHRPLPTFYLRIFFLDVDANDTVRRFVDTTLNITRLNPTRERVWIWGPNTTVSSNLKWWYNYKQTFTGDLVTFQITPTNMSILPALVNAIDVLGEFEAVTERTAETDGSTIEGFSRMFPDNVDTAGDPCLPVPWNWLVCSIEIPSRITQIKLPNKGGEGEIPANFGSLDRLTVLDVSDNMFSGRLPESLVGIVTLRELIISNNSLAGDLPPFEKLVNLETLSLRDNAFSGSVLSLVKALDSPLSTLDLSNNRFNGSVPMEIGNLVNLENLNLSFNNFTMLSSELFKLPNLETLSLQNNSLKGRVPDDILGSLSNMSSKLQTVNLDGNSFTELDLTTWLANGSSTYKVSLLDNQIRTVRLPPKDGVDRLCSSLQSRSQILTGFILLGGNPWCTRLLANEVNMTLAERYLCRQKEYQDFCTSLIDNSDPSGRGLMIGLTVSGIVVLLMACVLVASLRRMWRRMKDLRQIQEALAREDVRPPFFEYDKLKAATREFSPKNELGKGAFGAVYRAELPDRSIAAVKLLFETEQNIADFLKEMVVITGIKHRHLIQLKGCCVRDKKRMLVYEYAENGNLEQALWGGDRSFVLTWAQRLKICMGVAKGLSYLHEELLPKIIHRDIKPQNILLDKDWNAKIADFGLARPVEEDAEQLATHIGGTLGYFSPEYATQGLLTEKLDVYSYGIVVLEIVSGRRCICTHSSLPMEEVYLKNWAFKSYKEGHLVRIAENCILASAPGEDIESVLRMALLCLQEDHEKRPTMSQVVNMLAGNSSDLATDIVIELKDKQLLYENLYDSTITTTGKEQREDRALLHSTYCTDPKGMIELNVVGR